MGILRQVSFGQHRPAPLMFAAATLVLPNGQAPGMRDAHWETRQDDLDVFQIAAWEVDDVPVLLQRYRCEDKDRYTLRIAAQHAHSTSPSAMVRDVLNQWGVRDDQVEWWNHGLDLSVQPIVVRPAAPAPMPSLGSLASS